MAKAKTKPEEEGLVVQQPVAVMPVVSGAEFAASFKEYKLLQKSIDESMPEEIMLIQGKPYRKKGYWKALRAAFNLSVDCVHDERVEVTLDDGSVDWGWNIRYRATASSGAFMDGDGSCFKSEKTGGRLRATEHNVRAHAHTRAQNRAISGLVGFGEVSADEMPFEEVSIKKIKPRTEVVIDEPPPPTDSDAPSSNDTDVIKSDNDKLYVREVFTKTGNSNGRDWTLYAVTFSDDTKASTFDHPIGDLAEHAQSSELPVFVTMEPSKKNPEYLNIVELTLDGSE
jgi:hypothetical protein